ncbi:hypothetical protein U9M48_039569 [Paspalum notatum var. saurae]|uniref:Uncharacterized protein n=1 Tax=Paspalum notatum var. saurae TaxID=547442 RepID=A0AAQ3UKA2_PASNO
MSSRCRRPPAPAHVTLQLPLQLAPAQLPPPPASSSRRLPTPTAASPRHRWLVGATPSAAPALVGASTRAAPWVVGAPPVVVASTRRRPSGRHRQPPSLPLRSSSPNPTAAPLVVVANPRQWVLRSSSHIPASSPSIKPQRGGPITEKNKHLDNIFVIYLVIDMFVDGVRTYDASKDECFQLRAAILCSITDLPGLGYLHGVVTSGEKMVIAAEKGKDAPVCDYEAQRNANVLANKMKMKAMQLQELGQVASPPRTKKKRRVDAMTHQEKRMVADATIQHNLRTSSRLSAARANVQPLNGGIPSGDLQQGNGSSAASAYLQPRNGPSGDLQRGNGSSVASAHLQPRNGNTSRNEEKKKIREPTTKADIFARQNKPKLKVEINGSGQPCGPSSTEFVNFIGALVRTKGFPIAHDDWRKLYWDIDSSSFNWFMKTAAAKWRDFKSDLKRVFDEDMEYKELLELRDERVHEEDWKWLIDHWMSADGAGSYNSQLLELYMNHE